MTIQWTGPDNGDGRVADFAISKSEIEHRRMEVRQAISQLGAMSELSVVSVTEVCDSLGIDAYPIVSSVERLRNVCDAAILKLEDYM